jgi:hypothetical protein
MTHQDPVGETIICPTCDKPPATAGPEVVGDEPLTHCEWCGAEYPEPAEVSRGDASSGGTQTQG